jgi:hypothetical protein
MTLSFISVPSLLPSSLYPSSSFSDMTSQSPGVSSSSSATFNPNMGYTAATQVSLWPQSSMAAAAAQRVTLHPLSRAGSRQRNYREEERNRKKSYFKSLKGRLHGAFLMCVLVSDKPFDAESCVIGGQASATNGWSDIETQIKNAQCNRPLREKTRFFLQKDPASGRNPLCFVNLSIF